jgi:hypothetical protein
MRGIAIREVEQVVKEPLLRIPHLVVVHVGGYGGRRLASVCNKEKLQRILAYMLDENEFLSPYGIRSDPKSAIAAVAI